MAETFIGIVRTWIYNRWFFAFLASVSLLDLASDLLDFYRPGDHPLLDIVSVACSAVAAILAATIFLDLQLRRRKQ